MQNGTLASCYPKPTLQYPTSTIMNSFRQQINPQQNDEASLKLYCSTPMFVFTKNDDLKITFDSSFCRFIVKLVDYNNDKELLQKYFGY